MTPFSEKLTKVQQLLKQQRVDGWLLYDFRRSNDLAHRFLEIESKTLVTRRFFYWIPCQGDPVKIVHKIESEVLADLPGKIETYSSWQEFEQAVELVLKGKRCILMEYSARNAIPTLSKVDGGTLDLVRSFGVDVKSSGDILQAYTSIWTEKQFKMHQKAAEVLQDSIESAWDWIGMAIKRGQQITESDVQSFLLDRFSKEGCLCEDPPICAVNAHSANPHYIPTKESASLIKPGDFVLIDAWCKQEVSHAVYADLTRVAVIGHQPTIKQQQIFAIVKEARDAALELLCMRLAKGEPVQGSEVDRACREVIVKAGYGKFFPHRTGHNIGEKDHGEGANIDSFETQDDRYLLPGTCFSIEPGIYLPGEFGVRLEDNVYLCPKSGKIQVTKGMQEAIWCVQ